MQPQQPAFILFSLRVYWYTSLSILISFHVFKIRLCISNRRAHSWHIVCIESSLCACEWHATFDSIAPLFVTSKDSHSIPVVLFDFVSKNPWRKYRKGIHSEPIRTIPIHSDIRIRANANHSELIRKMFCNSFDEKR